MSTEPSHVETIKQRSRFLRGSLTLVLATAGIGTTLVGTLPAAHAAEAPVATQSSAHAAALPADPALRAAMQLFQRAADSG